MAGKSYKYVVTISSLDDAISIAWSGIEELREELQEIVDNSAVPDSPRIQTLESTLDLFNALVEIEMPEPYAAALPPDFPSLPASITYSLAAPRAKKGSTSRAVRAENYGAMLTAAAGALHDYLDACEVISSEDMHEALRTYLEDVKEVANDLDGQSGILSECEFPAMFG